ncbi:hypothetical protein ACPPVO_24175 [Dactylosporangium sp. McL0621]|uniref:hypothetical protein n=1 Tax=Dactylosporangium sp. McL0621 TaxID=3415678 RepID=UPI003CF20552
MAPSEFERGSLVPPDALDHVSAHGRYESAVTSRRWSPTVSELTRLELPIVPMCEHR